MEYGKKFLIIGNQNAITYKEIFPLIKDADSAINGKPTYARIAIRFKK